MGLRIIRWNDGIDRRTEEKQLMDADKKIGYKMNKLSVLKCDIVRIIEKLGLE
jgi:hypothetical protein